MVYVLSTIVISPGKMAEYGDIFTKELMPLYPEVGMKLVGSWHGYSSNMDDELYHLYIYNDLDAMQKAGAARLQNTDFKKVSARLNALRVSEVSTYLEPNAWSPML